MQSMDEIYQKYAQMVSAICCRRRAAKILWKN